MSRAVMIAPLLTLLAVISELCGASVVINDRVSSHDTFGPDVRPGAGERDRGGNPTTNTVVGGPIHYSDSVYRNLDNQLLRIGSKLDQLMFRMDHLDSRVGRVQSTGHLRFDSIETSMQTTRQRLDLWSNQLNLIEEQLSRKWKNMENRFDSLVSTLDSKLDTKFNLIQRDNRRHNEFISQSFNSVVISQEKLSDRVANSVNEMNVTVTTTASRINDSTAQSRSHSSMCVTRLESLVQNLTSSFSNPHPPNHHPHHHHHQEPPHHTSSSSSSTASHQHHPIRRTSILHQPEQLPYHRPYVYSSSSSYPYNTQLPQVPGISPPNSSHLISSKVSNMFDELVKRSHDLEAIVKDTFTMSNMTRREVQDGFMALIPIVSQVSLSGSGTGEKGGSTSGEVMSMVVEALSSVEQMSTSLARRMTEMSRSINERFEVVSMTLNGFLESCLRIQERAPQLEEKIGDVLWRILDSVDNSTRNATETWQKVKSALQFTNSTNCTNTIVTLSSDANANTNATTTQRENGSAKNQIPHHHHHHHPDQSRPREPESGITIPHAPEKQDHHHPDPYGVLSNTPDHVVDLDPTPLDSRLTEQEHQIWNTLASGGRLLEDDDESPHNHHDIEHVPE